MLAKVPRSRPVDSAASQLRAAILGGEPAPGEFLPAERELAVRLGVSRLTLRAAIARLEAEGLVRARQGDGVRVLDPAKHATLEVLAHLDLEQSAARLRSFLELRRAVACEAVAMACERMSDAAVEALVALAEAQRGEVDFDRFVERDLAFSRGVLEGADNFAMLLLLNSVETVYRAHPSLAAALHADRALSLAGYDAVLGLLRARDVERARVGVRAALEFADARALEALVGAPAPSPASSPRGASARRVRRTRA